MSESIERDTHHRPEWVPEQAGEAEGAHPGAELVGFVGARAPAALGADQQADGQGGGKIEQQVEGDGHRAIPCAAGQMSSLCNRRRRRALVAPETAAAALHTGAAAGLSAGSGGG